MGSTNDVCLELSLGYEDLNSDLAQEVQNLPGRRKMFSLVINAETSDGERNQIIRQVQVLREHGRMVKISDYNWQ